MTELWEVLDPGVVATIMSAASRPDLICRCDAPPRHRIGCPAVADQSRNAMVCPDGTFLYPDNPDDAQIMMVMDGARYVFDDGAAWVAGDTR